MLICVPPKYKQKGIFFINDLIKSIMPVLDQYVNQPIDIVTTLDEYNALADDKKYSYDVLTLQKGGADLKVLDDQAKNSK